MDWRVVLRAGAKHQWCASITEKATTVANRTRVVPRFESVATVSTGRGPAGGVVTHLTAVNKRHRGMGVGVGLRDAQLRAHGFDWCVMSPSSITKIHGICAAKWQHVTLTKMGYTKAVGQRFIDHMFEYFAWTRGSRI